MVGSEGSFLNLEVSLIIVYIFFTYSSQSRITLPHPLSGFNITMFLFCCNLVCSLFTSIPLKETIDIAVDLLFEHNPDFKLLKMN